MDEIYRINQKRVNKEQSSSLSNSSFQRASFLLYRYLSNYKELSAKTKISLPFLPSHFEVKLATFAYKDLDDKSCIITKSQSNNQDKDEWSSIRTDKAIPNKLGLYYFEVKVESFGQSGGQFVIGFGSQRTVLPRNMPGLDGESYGLAVHTGVLHCCGVQHQLCSSNAPVNGSVYGCGLNFLEDEIFFTFNGQLVARKRQINLMREQKSWFPMLGVKNSDVEISSNLMMKTDFQLSAGRSSLANSPGKRFELNFDSYLAQQRLAEERRCHEFFYSQSGRDAEIRELVLNFLLEHGYARSSEALFKTSSLGLHHNKTAEMLEIQSRASIVQQIFCNDLASALHLLQTDWPEFSIRYPLLHFKLLVMQFRCKIQAFLSAKQQPRIPDKQQSLESLPKSSSKVTGNLSDSTLDKIRQIQARHFNQHQPVASVKLPSEEWIHKSPLEGSDDSSPLIGDTNNQEWSNGHSASGIQHKSASMTWNHNEDCNGSTAAALNGTASEDRMEVDKISNSCGSNKAAANGQIKEESLLDLLDFGHYLVQKSLELKECHCIDAQFENFLNQLCVCVGKNELPPNDPESSQLLALMKSVDLALLSYRQLALAPSLSLEAERFERSLVNFGATTNNNSGNSPSAGRLGGVTASTTGTAASSSTNATGATRPALTARQSMFLLIQQPGFDASD